MLGLHPAAELPVPQQGLERAVDLLVEVDRADAEEPLAEAVEAVGQARDVVAHLLHLGGIGEPEPDDGQRVEVGPDGVGVGPALARDREHLLDQAARVRLAQHPGPVAPVAREQRVAEGVERPGARRERLEPGLELVLRELVVGDGDHRLAPVAAVGENVPHPLRQDARLARAGRGDHPHGTAVVGDGRELVGRQLRHRRGRLRRDRLEQPGVDRAGVDDGLGQARDAPARAAVDPGVAAVGEDDVGRASLARSQARRLRPPPPEGLAGAGVVVVGPDEVMEPVERQVERRRDRIGRRVGRLRGPEARGVDREDDHDRAPGDPVLVQPPHRLVGGAQHALVDLDRLHGGRRPGLRDSAPGQDDHPAA